jgi:hypothetical protein
MAIPHNLNIKKRLGKFLFMDLSDIISHLLKYQNGCRIKTSKLKRDEAYAIITAGCGHSALYRVYGGDSRMLRPTFVGVGYAPRL